MNQVLTSKVFSDGKTSILTNGTPLTSLVMQTIVNFRNREKTLVWIESMIKIQDLSITVDAIEMEIEKSNTHIGRILRYDILINHIGRKIRTEGLSTTSQYTKLKQALIDKRSSLIMEGVFSYLSK